MKFQNPSFKFFLNGRTNVRTKGQAQTNMLPTFSKLGANRPDKNVFPENLRHIMRKPAFCKCKNKDADQLSGSRAAVQGVCFCYKNSKLPLLP